MTKLNAEELKIVLSLPAEDFPQELKDKIKIIQEEAKGGNNG